MWLYASTIAYLPNNLVCILMSKPKAHVVVVLAILIDDFGLTHARCSLTTANPRKSEIADIPTTKIKAGMRTAHSLDGK